MSHSMYTVDPGEFPWQFLATNKIEWMPDVQMPKLAGGWCGDEECLLPEGMNNSGPGGPVASWPLGRMSTTRPARR